MKQQLLVALAASLFAYGIVLAEDNMPAGADRSGTVINNDDLKDVSPDQNDSTFNRMPEDRSVEGSDAGGVSSLPDLKDDDGLRPGPAGGQPMVPEPAAPGSDRSGTETYDPQY